MEGPLSVAFVWNQHQPFYADREMKEYIMPWVRLHATKDYYQMAAILKKYPNIKQTFNLTPSLLEQLEDYLSGSQDYYQAVMKPVKSLSEAEKQFLLLHYFDINWERVIAKYPRYQELLEKQGGVTEPNKIHDALRNFSEEDYIDLQVWFNLVWIDPELIEEDGFLSGLMNKERGYTEEDKITLMHKHYEIMSRVITEHKKRLDAKQLEIMTTPYYHPILPLLINNHVARRSSPGMPLPRLFSYPEDARGHVVKAVRQFKRLFGKRPYGMWPPEMGVSPEIVNMMSEQKFTWTISDEDILKKSTGKEIYRDNYGHVQNPAELYKPYRVEYEGQEINIIFRDHYLSDRLGFVYHDWKPDDAANDIIHRLHKIREKLTGVAGSYLVTISLDGENAWEWYPNDKKDFLNHLYTRLSGEGMLKTVRVNDFLRKHPPKETIGNLYSGSWVDSNFNRWIGSANKNTIWEYLYYTRRDFERLKAEEDIPDSAMKKALENLYIAEGSDYPWWVDSMPYHLTAPFEALFRKHLSNVYHALGKKPPLYLNTPIIVPDKNGQCTQPLEGPTAMCR